MKLYVWHKIDAVTDKWHDYGAVLIITDRDYEDVWNDYADSIETRYNPLRVSLGAPDLSIVVSAEEEKLFVYPDAGRC